MNRYKQVVKESSFKAPIWLIVSNKRHEAVAIACLSPAIAATIIELISYGTSYEVIKSKYHNDTDYDEVATEYFRRGYDILQSIDSYREDIKIIDLKALLK